MQVKRAVLRTEISIYRHFEISVRSAVSGERVSNTQITNPKIGHNSSKGELIPNSPKAVMFWVKEQSVLGWVCGLSACW